MDVQSLQFQTQDRLDTTSVFLEEYTHTYTYTTLMSTTIHLLISSAPSDTLHPTWITAAHVCTFVYPLALEDLSTFVIPDNLSPTQALMPISFIVWRDMTPAAVPWRRTYQYESTQKHTSSQIVYPNTNTSSTCSSIDVALSPCFLDENK